jgi:hypothetical protein
MMSTGISPDLATSGLLAARSPARFHSPPSARPRPADAPVPVHDVMARIDHLQQLVDRLWQEALDVDERVLSARLVDVSHSLQRASRRLQGEAEIG